jgi:predicted aminopeptidase
MFVKKIALSIFILLLIICIWQYALLHYALVQLAGQLSLIYHTQPIEYVINDKNFPKEKKEKLLLIADIKQFTVAELGFNSSENYTSYYDQHNQPLMYVVSACPKYSMQEYEWNFPIAGSFTYKGFFIREMANKEVEARKNDGLDVYLGTASGWSTLGWLKDPVLSGMLNKSKGELSELIIHELTHSFKYDKNNVTFNENLATFVGQKGALDFISKYYGSSSSEIQEYKAMLHDNQLFDERMTNGYYELDSLYRSFGNATSEVDKNLLKQALIDKIIGSINQLDLIDKNRYHFIVEKKNKINNAWFASFKRYNTLQIEFERSLKTAGGDLKKWLITTDFSQFSNQ